MFELGFSLNQVLLEFLRGWRKLFLCLSRRNKSACLKELEKSAPLFDLMIGATPLEIKHPSYDLSCKVAFLKIHEED